MRQVRLESGERDVDLGHLGPDLVHQPAGSRGFSLLAVGGLMAVARAAPRRSQTSDLRSSSDRTRPSSCRSPASSARSRASRRSSIWSSSARRAAARRDSSSAAASSRRRTSAADAAARSTRTACVARASEATARRRRSSVARLGEPLLGLSERSSAIRWSSSVGADRRRRASCCRDSSAARSSSARRRSELTSCHALREPIDVVGGALELGLEPDQRLLLLVLVGHQAGDGGVGGGDGRTRARPLRRPAAQADRSSSTRSRSSLISRLVARMPRDSARPPPLTWWRPRTSFAGQRDDRRRSCAPRRRSPSSSVGAIQASPMATRIAGSVRPGRPARLTATASRPSTGGRPCTVRRAAPPPGPPPGTRTVRPRVRE